MKPVVIVGAGPAGLSCARELAEADREVVLVDDNPQAGGQYYRQLPQGYAAAPGNRLLRDAEGFRPLAAILKHPRVRHLKTSVAWAAPGPLTIAFAGPEGSGRIEASAVVLATGAQETPFPFPGWTLPGIISAGGCLNLAKGQGLVPEGRVLVAGNGPLVLVAAATLLTAGADVIGVVEAQSDRRLIRAALSGMRAAPEIMLTAARYRGRILSSPAWMRKGWMLTEAKGDGSLAKVAIAPVGSDGRPILSRREWHEVDALVTGYGLAPASDMARMIGCRTEHVPELNGIVPVRSEHFETSVPNVYAIGDGAGIGGAVTSKVEGQLAARAIVERAADTGIKRRYRRLDAFRRKLNRAYTTTVPLDATTPDTIVCRCEELTLSDLQQDDNFARGSVDRLKTSSRIGMGRCQGRNCLPHLHAILGIDVADRSSDPRSRPPARPTQLRYLAADADAGLAREPDELDTSRSSKDDAIP